MFRFLFPLLLLYFAGHATAASWLDGYRAAAEALVADLNNNSTEHYTAMLDKRSIVLGIMEDVQAERREIIQMRKSFVHNLNLAGNRFLARIPEGGRLKLLRVARKRGAVRALVRFPTEDNSFGYREFELKEYDTGVVVIRDWFDYSTGRFFSESARTTLMVSLDQAHELQGVTRGELENSELATFFRLFRGKQFRQAVHTYEGLIERIRRNRTLIFLYIQAAAMSGDMQLYSGALESMYKYYGSEPAFAFLLKDRYLLSGDYAGAARALELAAKEMGVIDAGMLAMQASVWLAAGDIDKALNFCGKSVEMEAELEAPLWTLLQAYARKGEFDKTVATAQALQDRYAYRLDAEFFNASDAFAEFVRSDQYSEWISQFE